VHVNKPKELKSVSNNSKVAKKACPCKEEVTDYPYQNSIGACKRLVCAVQQTCKISIVVKDSMAITAELHSII